MSRLLRWGPLTVGLLFLLGLTFAQPVLDYLVTCHITIADIR